MILSIPLIMTFSRIYIQEEWFFNLLKYISKRFIFRKIYIQHYASFIAFYFIRTFAFKFATYKSHEY